MAKIGREEVLRVARLARIELRPEEIERMTAQLGAVLDHVAKMEALDLTDVEPTAHAVPMAAPWRDDEPAPSLPCDLALEAAPRAEAGLFAVPRIIARDE